jgi:hypothetical protein
MNRLRFRHVLVPLALLLSPSLRGAQAQPQGQPAGPPVVSLSEIVLDQYQVEHVDPEDLFELANSMVGRAYYVKESNDKVSGLRRLGRTIVLYDTKEQVQRARELLASLDKPREGSDSSSYKVAEYRPRFVSLNTAVAAVGELVELSVVKERGMLVLHDDAEDVESALTLLQRIDEAEKQVLLTCQLLEVGGERQGPALPKELVDNLLRLLPESTFAQVGMAMLKTSVGGQDSLSVQIESTGKRYRFSFTPVAFDESTGSLTVSGCCLVEEVERNTERQLFVTNTVLRGGEYTVLAATGATPRLLVVRVTPQK